MECGSGGAGNFAGRERAQTPIIGLVLLIGIVALASLGILLVAGESTADVQQQAENERVESAFLELGQELRTASTASDVTRSVALDVERNGGRVTRTDSGTVRIQVDGGETVERSLGSLEYTADDGTRVVYQAGGVWRVVDDEVRTISEPTIHFSDGTLTFPVAVLAADEATERVGTAPLSLATERSEPLYSGMNRENVTLTIESEFYEWWAEYFADVETGSSNVTVVTNPTTKTANATFEARGEQEGIDSGAVVDPERTVVTEGQLVTADGGGSETIGDVYAAGGVDVKHRIEGDVVTDGDVTLQGEGEVTGTIVAGGDVIYGDGTEANDIIAGGDVVIKGRVDGDVYAYGDIRVHYGNLNGDLVAAGSIDDNWQCNAGCTATEYVPAEDIGPHPSDYIDEIQDREPIDDFYADALANADAEELGTLTQGDELTAGTYVVDAIDVRLDSLDFDVADGNVDVFVRGPVEMGDEGEFRVYNSDSGNAARLYVDDTVTIRGTHGNGICAVPNRGIACGSIPAAKRDANGFQLYGTTDAEFVFRDQLVMHGVVYAPTSAGAPPNAEVQAGGNLEFFGSFVVGGLSGTGEVSFEQDAGMSYTAPTVGGDASTSTTAEELTFVHVTAHEIDVSGE